MKQDTNKQILQIIKRNTKKSGSCWIWTGHRAGGITPILWGEHIGSIRTVRQVIHKLKTGVDTYHMGKPLAPPICGRSSCANPEHHSGKFVKDNHNNDNEEPVKWW